MQSAAEIFRRYGFERKSTETRRSTLRLWIRIPRVCRVGDFRALTWWYPRADRRSINPSGSVEDNIMSIDYMTPSNEKYRPIVLDRMCFSSRRLLTVRAAGTWKNSSALSVFLLFFLHPYSSNTPYARAYVTHMRRRCRIAFDDNHRRRNVGPPSITTDETATITYTSSGYKN